MSRLSVLAGTALLSLAAASTVYAQAAATAGVHERNPVELGMDAGVSIGLDDPSYTTISIPVQSIRAGFMISPRFSLEPSLGLTYMHFSGESLTQYRALVGLLYHFQMNRHANQWYVRPFAGITGVSGSGSSDTQAEIGGGLGIKIPMAARVSTRFEANFEHGFKSGDVASSNAIGILAGLSFFTH